MSSSLTAASSTLLRACSRQSLASAGRATASAAIQQRNSSSSAFDSPFKKADTTQIPSFKAYKSKSAETSNRVFSYFMVGTMGMLTAAGAKATVQGASFSNSKGEECGCLNWLNLALGYAVVGNWGES